MRRLARRRFELRGDESRFLPRHEQEVVHVALGTDVVDPVRVVNPVALVVELINGTKRMLFQDLPG